MNRQAIFETVSTHLLYQFYGSRAPNGDCLYRGPDARKCAIGCFIPDDEYVPCIESKAVDCDPKSPHSTPEERKVIATFRNILSNVFGELTSSDREFLRYLQRIHDNHTCNYFEHLENFGKNSGLDTSFLHGENYALGYEN